MSFLAWLARFLGLPLMVDGMPTPQCVDAVNSYLDRVRRVPHVTGNADDIAGQRISGAVWTPNGPSNYPSPGDVIVWRGNVPAVSIGPYGHCAVAILADAMTILSADQNWGRKPYLAVIAHSYIGVAGWHHFLP